MSGYKFNFVHLAPDEQIGLHVDRTWELSYIIIGSGTRTIGSIEEPFTAGEVVMVPPGMPHCWRFDPETTDCHGKISNITVMFQPDWLDSLAALLPELSAEIGRIKGMSEAVKFSRQSASELIDLLAEMCSATVQERVPLMLRLLLVMAAGAGGSVVGHHKPVDRAEERLRQVEIYVSCNMCREITLDDIARHVGMSRVAFCLFFKKATGQTFVTWLNGRRVEEACRLLIETERPVAEIGYAVGFQNVPYFNRVFKRVKGIAPSKIRDGF